MATKTNSRVSKCRVKEKRKLFELNLIIIPIHLGFIYRGVAQLVACMIWIHDVRSSSLFTPTKDIIRMVAV